MPIYEYECAACAAGFELLVRSEETPQCPDCGSEKLEKQISIAAAHSSSSRQLPVRTPAPPGGGCGLPQCGTGGCMGQP